MSDVVGYIPSGHGPLLTLSSLAMAYLPLQRPKIQVHLVSGMWTCHPILVKRDLRKALLKAGEGSGKGFLHL